MKKREARRGASKPHAPQTSGPDPVVESQTGHPGPLVAEVAASEVEVGADASQSATIVGIGASAGGLEACAQLLSHLPVNTGMAFVVVQHLDPRHESMLSTLLGRRSTIPVSEIVDGVQLQPNQVYVIPPDTSVTVVYGHLRLQPRGTEAGVRTPIDGFFQSLARTHGSLSVGVVLSGTGSDGAHGLQAIKAAGGITFAQDEASAAFSGMPHSAVASGAVDFVGAPDDIAAQLGRIGRGLTTAAAKPSGARTSADHDLERVFAFLRTRTGVDFSEYKRTTVERRLLRRIVLHRLESLRAYGEYLGNNPAEADALFSDLLIGVSSFFRDAAVFDVLLRTVIPGLLQERAKDASLRIWVPGCSGGEEAYSIAICLVEAVNQGELDLPIQIFATDLSDEAIARARAGLFPITIEHDVSAERLRRFFVREQGGYRIAKSIRDRCIFAKQNLITDPPFSQLDLISCRNLLIYLDAGVQKRVLSLLHYALKPSGFLILGSAESLGAASALFTPFDKKNRIFRNTDRPGRKVPEFVPHNATTAGRAAKFKAQGRTGSGSGVQEHADQILLASYAPSGVVINERSEVVQFRGVTRDYFEPAAGEATLDLFRLARRELIPALRRVVRRSRETGEPARETRVRFPLAGASRLITIEAIPFTLPGTEAQYHIVLFDDAAERTAAASLDAMQPTPAVDEAQDRRDLEAELAMTRRYLEELIEDQEASNEELRASNEEIQSANEELQSTNEELETAKEEIQSANEELTTVNEELRVRNAELGQLNSDLTNVLASTNLPMVIVGTDYRIRRFTPSIDRVMKIIATDVGRPLSDIRLTVDLPQLPHMIARAIDSLAVSESEVQDEQGSWYVVRVRPYKTIDHRIDGAVISFLDIDELKQHEQRIQHAREYAENIVETVHEALIILDGALKVRTANRAFYRLFQTSRNETEGAFLFDLGQRQWNTPALRLALEQVLDDQPSFEDFEVTQTFPVIGRRTMVLNGRRIDFGLDPLILLAIEDITDRKLADDRGRFLAEASRVLVSVLDQRVTLDGLATLLVPALADWCAVDLIREDNHVERVVVAPKDSAVALELRPAPLEDATNPVHKVLTTGRPLVIEELTPLELKSITGTAEQLAFLREVSHQSMLVFPILTQGRPSGAVTLISYLPGRRYTAADFTVFDSLGRWVGLALENAELLSATKVALAAAEEANRAKGLFLTTMSHELRTPLNAMTGYVQLLEMGIHGAVTEAQVEDLRRISRCAHQLNSLISQVLNFARIEVGQVEFALQDIRAGEILADAALLVEPQMQASGLVFEHLTCPTDLVTRADPSKLQQILLNLLSNAIKFTPKGGTISLSCEARGEKIAFSVRDTGRGIQPDRTRLIFEPFVQLDTSHSRTADGVGLGLAISRELAELMNGELTVESTPGVGSTFTLTLPAIRSVELRAAPMLEP